LWLLIKTLQVQQVWAAALDVTRSHEPLPRLLRFSWSMPNVSLTPHTAVEHGPTKTNVIDLLIETLERLWRGEKTLSHQVTLAAYFFSLACCCVLWLRLLRRRRRWALRPALAVDCEAAAARDAALVDCCGCGGGARMRLLL